MIADTIQTDRIVDSLHEIYDAVRNHDVDIAVVCLHDIIKKYLHNIDDSPDEFSLLVKFYVIYAKLLHLKLSSLFPVADVEEAEEDINSLIQDIFDYKKSQELSQVLLSSYIPDARYFINKQKMAIHTHLKESSSIFTNVTVGNSDKNLHRLVQAFSKFIQINQRLALAPKVQRFSLKIMRERILFRIKQSTKTLHDMVDANEQSYHVVAATLTVLILCAERRINLAQRSPFDTISLQIVSPK